MESVSLHAETLVRRAAEDITNAQTTTLRALTASA
jgi:hypothetical protein